MNKHFGRYLMFAALMIVMTGVPLQLLHVGSAHAMGSGGGHSRGDGGANRGGDSYGTPFQGGGSQGVNDQGSGGVSGVEATHAVSEPTTLYMLLAGLTGAGIYYGFRRRRHAIGQKV
jgi:hypothetical protein